MRNVPFIVSAAIFTLLFLLLTIGAQGLTPNVPYFGLDRTVIVSIAASIASSGAFFFCVEIFRGLHDRKQDHMEKELTKFQKTFGIKAIFHGKSSEEAMLAYKNSIENAKTRVWALGLSNDQFIQHHLQAIKARKGRYKKLHVRVFFFDPEATVTRGSSLNDYSLVNLFDFPYEAVLNESRVKEAHRLAREVLDETELDAEVYYALLPCYFSLMIVDNTAYFFPFIMAHEDASANPMMMVDTDGEIGKRLELHVEELVKKPLLCRQLDSTHADSTPPPAVS